MKSIQCLIMAAGAAVLLSGCGNHDTEEIRAIEKEIIGETESQQEESSEESEEATEKETGESDKENESFSGFWSVDGLSHGTILEEGGTELTCVVVGNSFSGWLFTGQAGTDRFAEIDDIVGTIENNEMYYDFTDDGWKGSGTLHFQFSANEVRIDVQNYHMDESNMTGYGISGSYTLVRLEQGSRRETEEMKVLTDEELAEKIHEIYYVPWTEKTMYQAISERSPYYEQSSYYEQVTDYWENTRGVRDIANYIEPLFYTDLKLYTKEDLANEPKFVIHLAKNEMYARHGYIFKDKDLYNYFMGCIWYEPTVEAGDFDISILNPYEKENLKLLSELDS